MERDPPAALRLLRTATMPGREQMLRALRAMATPAGAWCLKPQDRSNIITERREAAARPMAIVPIRNTIAPDRGIPGIITTAVTPPVAHRTTVRVPPTHLREAAAQMLGRARTRGRAAVAADVEETKL